MTYGQKASFVSLNLRIMTIRCTYGLVSTDLTSSLLSIRQTCDSLCGWFPHIETMNLFPNNHGGVR